MNQNVYKLYPFRACPAVKNQPIFTASPVLRRRDERGKSQSPEDAPQLPECPQDLRTTHAPEGSPSVDSSNHSAHARGDLSRYHRKNRLRTEGAGTGTRDSRAGIERRRNACLREAHPALLGARSVESPKALRDN